MKAGIVSYGIYIPMYRITAREIAKIWGKDPKEIENGLLIKEKSVPGIDEDTVTISVEAARNCIKRVRVDPSEIGAIFVGSESHPYAVKPTATIVGEAIGATPEMTAADYEFACKAGTAGIQTSLGLVNSGMIKYGLAIGADTAQGAPGDPLEYSASAGGAAFLIGSKDKIAEVLDTYSFTTDTPDFWRREGKAYPRHAGRFTGAPAYFKHIISASRGIMERNSIEPKEIDYVVFHQPNGKFPMRAAKLLGFEKEQYLPGIVVTQIGNTYSASSLIGLSAVLDVCNGGEKVLLTSFGSGAGSDSFLLEVTDKIVEIKDKAPKFSEFIRRKKYLSYGEYLKLSGKIKLS
ncbi:MAG TPA: hydroxymethylglutaryl-CoA synthase [Euryarchaeota archaeon]|nr:MAG: hydroxymethylglutaryl-CoA synthase [Thermococci archaeon]HDI10504.1 hydroxymethylglutaryl-CoA synthase [Euryarchaeota archaeon]